MSENQYRRANLKAFAVDSIICACIFFMELVIALATGFTAGAIIQLGGCVAGYLMTLFGLMMERGTKKGAIMIMGGSSIVYFLTMILKTDPVYFMFGCTILFSSMVYLNMRIVYSGEAVIAAGFAISLIRATLTGGFTWTYFIYLAVLILSGVAAAESVKLLVKFNEENNETIREQMTRQNESGAKMAEIAGNITTLFGKAKESMESLRGVIESNNSGMQNIASSMESTAQEITDQATRCQEIQEQTQATDEKRPRMRNRRLRKARTRS